MPSDMMDLDEPLDVPEPPRDPSASVYHMDIDDPSTPPRPLPLPRHESVPIIDAPIQPPLQSAVAKVPPTPSKRKKPPKNRKASQQQVVQNNYHYTPDQPSKWLANETPYALLGYLQVLFNLSILSLALYLILTLVWNVFSDVQDKMTAYTMEVREEIYTCAKHYQQTGCGTPNVIDLAVQHCEGWKQCMERDPMKIGRVRVGAETFAEILNGFVDVMSWKTMIFLCAFSGLAIFFANSAISHKRAQFHPAHSPYAPQHPNPLLYHQAPYWLGPHSAPSTLEPPQQAPLAQLQTGRKKGWFR